MALNIFQDYYRNYMKDSTYILVVGILLLGVLLYNNKESFQFTESPLKISIQEARSRRFGLIIDVRTPEQRSRLGYYPNSIPISLEKLEMEVPLDISNKKTWILVYSNGDDKAQFAANKLFEKGYTNTRYIDDTYLRLMPGSQ